MPRKLTQLQRIEVAVRYLPGVVSMTALAHEYKVDVSYVSRLVRKAGGAANRPADPAKAGTGVATCENERCGKLYLRRNASHRFCHRRCRQQQWLREKRKEGKNGEAIARAGGTVPQLPLPPGYAAGGLGAGGV